MLGLGTAVNRGGFVSGAAAAKLLDTYSSAAAAYSFRQLSNSYSGNAVKVRRASDDTELDIGFSSGELDTSALATHCGSSDGFVVTWYDQSGNSNNATQSTAANQPKIYDGSAVRHITDNGKPAARWTSVSMSLIATPSAAIPQPYTLIAIGSNEDYVNLAGLADIQQGYWLGTHYTGGGRNIIRFGSQLFGNASSPNQSIYYGLGNGSSSQLAVNGTIEATGNAGTLDLTRFGIGATFGYLGYIQEVVYYPSDQSSNRTAIESDINTFYSIY
tara:strand:+ start:287 stop:1105 length:819 start_codon:yes stop_codon:yes gene_type:complete